MDPLARLMLGSKDFVDITKTLLIQADIHSEGRLVMVHEGGQAHFLGTACFSAVLWVFSMFCFFLCTTVRPTPNGRVFFSRQPCCLFTSKADTSVKADLFFNTTLSAGVRCKGRLIVTCYTQTIQVIPELAVRNHEMPGQATAGQLQASALSVRVISTSLPAPLRAVSTWCSHSTINQTVLRCFPQSELVSQRKRTNAKFSLPQQTSYYLSLIHI